MKLFSATSNMINMNISDGFPQSVTKIPFETIETVLLRTVVTIWLHINTSQLNLEKNSIMLQW